MHLMGEVYLAVGLKEGNKIPSTLQRTNLSFFLFKKNQHALMHMSVSIYTQKEKSLRIFTKMLTHYLVGKSGEDFFKNFFWFIFIFQFFYSKHGLHELLKIPT